MIDRRHVRLVSVALLAVVCASAAHAAKKQPTSPAPTPKPSAPATPAPAARPDSSALVLATPSGVARTPGPLVTPGSPVEDRTTIAPFPIPGDTSRAARERSKMMNVPRQGMTALEPRPRGTNRWYRYKGLLVPADDSLISPPEIDVQPEPFRPPAPIYPDSARKAGVQGIVLVMAHVGKDGRVGETLVVKSIPALDDAAVRAVLRMGFRPASVQGRPVAVWVGIPVRFTLH